MIEDECHKLIAEAILEAVGPARRKRPADEL
jgi:hypothetical protein